jgi:hypothetical protein
MDIEWVSRLINHGSNGRTTEAALEILKVYSALSNFIEYLTSWQVLCSLWYGTYRILISPFNQGAKS